MDIDEDEQNDAISTVPDIVLEDYQIKNLSYLTQQQHLKSIIRLSDNVSSFQPLCYFLITIISRWPHEKFNLSSYILFKCDKMFPKVLLQSFNKSILAQKLQTETSFASLINDSLYLPDWSTLMLFCELYSRLLFTMADEEFFSIDGIIVLADIIPLTLILKKIVYELYWNPSTMTSKGHFCDSILSLTYGREIFSRILSQIYTRE
ncbi:hypothetical protein BC833DRAFT_387860 [Globomyces pollinis-pini]|nr:hypothetical protein BC833DRAFT_387860 [Globomyces pollinis-pini]